MTGQRIVVADDHPVFRSGLTMLLEDLGMVVVAEAEDGAAAVTAVGRHEPDVVLMDLQMPGMNGVAATAQIARAHPRTAVLVLTMSEDDDSVYAALRAGARGYLLKESAKDDIARAIDAVSRGEAVFGPRVAERVMAFFTEARPWTDAVPFPQLTDREREVLDQMARGRDNHQIAVRLCLSDKTVRNRVSEVLVKIGASHRAEAVALARDAGLGRGV